MNRRPVLLPAALAILFAATTAHTEARAEPPPDQKTSFIKVEGRHLVRNGRRLMLRAVNFSNFYFMDLSPAELLESPHHFAADFGRVRELGFNAVRFAFNGDWYDRDRNTFFRWLDRNVQMSNDHGINLILDLHTPIGSFWLDPTKRVNFDIWRDPKIQQKNIKMWKDIAARYRDRENIAALDILNEPVTLDETGQQWRDLAGKLVSAIREVNKNHVIIVGALYGTEGQYGTQGLERHFLVDDNNALYDFHFYEPIRYTHQSAKWLERPTDDGGRYPDPKVLLPTGGQILIPNARISTPSVVDGDSDWQLYDSGRVTVTDKAAVAGLPMVVARGPVHGTVHVDDVKVLEYDRAGNLIGEVARDPLDEERVLHWYPWGQQNSDTSKFRISWDIGFNDDYSLVISGLERNRISGWSSDDNFFAIVPGHSYRIVGRLRGQDIRPSGGSERGGVYLEIDFYKNPAGSSRGAFIGRTKRLLEHKMQESLEFGAKHNVPMSVMEFGLIGTAFKGKRGGAAWLRDILELLEKHTVAYAYWEYHGDTMGVFVRNSGEFEFAHPPIRPNPKLVHALEDALKPPHKTMIASDPISPKRDPSVLLKRP